MDTRTRIRDLYTVMSLRFEHGLPYNTKWDRRFFDMFCILVFVDECCIFWRCLLLMMFGWQDGHCTRELRYEFTFGWEILRINRSINKVPRSLSTASSRSTQNKPLTQANPARMWRIIPPSTCRSCLIAVCSFGNEFHWMRCVYRCGISVLLMRLSPALVSKSPCKMCIVESDTPSESRQR